MTRILISLSADGFKKGDRCVVKAGRSEWYVGTISTAGKRLKIAFDDGASATVGPEDFKDVRHIDAKTKKIKKVLNTADAKALYTAGKPATTLKAAKVKVAAIKAAPAAPTKAAKVRPSEAPYFNWLGGITKEKAQARVNKLTAQVEKINAVAMRASRRHQDAGPMDMAYDKTFPLNTEIDLLKWHINSPGKPLTTILQKEFDSFVADKQNAEQRKAENKAKAESFASVVGHTIQFMGRPRGSYGPQLIEAVVLSQKVGRFGAPVYKAQVPGQTATWSVKHQSVKKFTVPKNHKAVLAALKDKADLLSSTKDALKIGDTVSFLARGVTRPGTIVGKGRLKLRVSETGKGLVWVVPVANIKTINGKAV